MCPDEKMFTEYLDDELEAEYRKLIDEHFMICPECGQLIRQLETVRQKMHIPVNKIDTENALGRVWAGLYSESDRRFSRRPRFVAVMMRAAVLVVFLAGGFFAGRVITSSSYGKFIIPAQTFELKEQKLEEVTNYLYHSNESGEKTDTDTSIVITEEELQKLVDLLSSRSAVMEVKISLPNESDFSIIGQPEIKRSSEIKRRKE
jgi:hypothetical protein